MADISFTLTPYIEMLYSITPPADYHNWLRIIIAAKSAGIPYEVVDDWSAQDPTRYNEPENRKKWESVKLAGGITPATLVKHATEAGWTPQKKPIMTSRSIVLAKGTAKSSEKIDAISYPQYNSTESVVKDTNVQSAGKKDAILEGLTSRIVAPLYKDFDPIKEALSFLETVYEPEDLVRIVTASRSTERSNGEIHIGPSGVGKTAVVADLCQQLQHAEKLEDVIGDYNHDAGVWISMNPMKEGGSKDTDVARFRYFLVECDDLEKGSQLAQLEKSGLPIQIITDSGNKSLHAFVRCPTEITSTEGYKKAASDLYGQLEAMGMHPDKSCSNPSRLTRLPGAIRGSSKQCIVAKNIGCDTYVEWQQRKQQLIDNLKIDQKYGAPEYLSSMEKRTAEAESFIIDGVLRPGQITEIIGRSKAGKSLLALQMSISICSGKDFLGRKCNRVNKMLYCNLEISSSDMRSREIDQLIALGMTNADIPNLAVWNLRGADIKVDQFVSDLILKIKVEKYEVVVLDPVYILFKDVDENDNSAITTYMQKLQRVLRETGCAMIIVHHASDKSSDKRSQPSGASAFLRMYDTLITISSVKLPKNYPEELIKSDYPYRIEFKFRNTSDIDPIGAWRDSVVFVRDETKILGYCDPGITDKTSDQAIRDQLIDEAMKRRKC